MQCAMPLPPVIDPSLQRHPALGQAYLRVYRRKLDTVAVRVQQLAAAGCYVKRAKVEVILTLTPANTLLPEVYIRA